MLKLALIAVLGAPVLGGIFGVTDSASPIDIPTLATYYGVAAPFAGICLWQMIRAQKKLDETLKDCNGLREKMLQRAETLNERLAPMMYDSARLVRASTEVTVDAARTIPDPKVAELNTKLDALLARMDPRDFPGRAGG